MTPITDLAALLRKRRTVRDFETRPIGRTQLRGLLWAAQGVTDSSGYRTAPSALAVYPLRPFVTAANIDGLPSGRYPVLSNDPELGPVRDEGANLADILQAAALMDQPWIGSAACIISVCADFAVANEAVADQPPRGERGDRYVYMEAGACAQNVLLQAANEGLGAVLVAGIDEAATSAAMHLDPALSPVLHICVGWPKAGTPASDPS